MGLEEGPVGDRAAGASAMVAAAGQSEAGEMEACQVPMVGLGLGLALVLGLVWVLVLVLVLVGMGMGMVGRVPALAALDPLEAQAQDQVGWGHCLEAPVQVRRGQVRVGKDRVGVEKVASVWALGDSPVAWVRARARVLAQVQAGMVLLVDRLAAPQVGRVLLVVVQVGSQAPQVGRKEPLEDSQKPQVGSLAPLEDRKVPLVDSQAPLEVRLAPVVDRMHHHHHQGWAHSMVLEARLHSLLLPHMARNSHSPPHAQVDILTWECGRSYHPSACGYAHRTYQAVP